MIKFTMTIAICVFCASFVEKAWAETEEVVTTTPAERIEAAREAAGEEAAYRAACAESEKAQALAWAARVRYRHAARNYVTTPVRVAASAAMTTDGLVLAVPGLVIVDLGRMILPGEVEDQRREDDEKRDELDREYNRGKYAPVVVEGAK